jgi:hypothetical protein
MSTTDLPTLAAAAPGQWETPEGRAIAVEYLAREREDLCHGEMADLVLANAVFLANRTDLDLIHYQTAAKERIRWLSARLAGIAAILREPGGEQLDKLLRIGDLVGVARPPRHESPVRMGEDWP